MLKRIMIVATIELQTFLPPPLTPMPTQKHWPYLIAAEYERVGRGVVFIDAIFCGLASLEGLTPGNSQLVVNTVIKALDGILNWLEFLIHDSNFIFIRKTDPKLHGPMYASRIIEKLVQEAPEKLTKNTELLDRIADVLLLVYGREEDPTVGGFTISEYDTFIAPLHESVIFCLVNNDIKKHLLDKLESWTTQEHSQLVSQTLIHLDRWHSVHPKYEHAKPIPDNVQRSAVCFLNIIEVLSGSKRCCEAFVKGCLWRRAMLFAGNLGTFQFRATMFLYPRGPQRSHLVLPELLIGGLIDVIARAMADLPATEGRLRMEYKTWPNVHQAMFEILCQHLRSEAAYPAIFAAFQEAYTRLIAKVQQRKDIPENIILSQEAPKAWKGMMQYGFVSYSHAYNEGVQLKKKAKATLCYNLKVCYLAGTYEFE